MAGAITGPKERWRTARRRTFRRLADRTTRKRILLVLATLVAIGLLAAVKGIIGYYVFSSGTTRIEVALTFVAAIAAVFALCERKVASFIESRFNRNTKQHRDALAALREELAEVAERADLERRLVARFDALFATHGTALYVGDGETYTAVAHSRARQPDDLGDSDPIVVALRRSQLPVVPADVGSDDDAPLAWPLRARGHLVGILLAGQHDYLESFDASEIEAVQALADSAAANLTFIDPSLTAHLVHTPNNLPPLTNAFVGREREIVECRDILSTTRLLTLTGFGGAGKSRLAHEIASGALASHRGGVFWIDLADVHDEAHVVSAIAAVLGVSDLDHGSAAIAGRLGNGDALLVLDTCEHVRTAVARVAGSLLHECPRVRMLLTSQSPVGIPGERDFAVPPLATAVDGTEAAASDAAQLFVERARAVVPGFAPDAAAMQDIAGIVAALDGIPLAIELAAARMKVMSASAIRAHLDESLKLLGGGDAADARHQTMRASLAWSYDPLVEADQALLRRLSVFAGGFTLEAAARVGANASDALDVLDPIGRLAEASLLLVSRRGDDEPRYHLPETLRQFLAELLAHESDARETRERHARWFLDLAKREAAALHQRGVVNARALALARLDAESGNFSSAHRFAMQAEDASLVLELAHALVGYWRDRGLVVRALARVHEALAHPATRHSPHARTEALLDAALLQIDCGDATAAAASANEAVACAQDLAARDLECLARARRAHASIALGAPWEDDVTQAIALARAAQDRALLRATLDDAGEIYARAQRLPEAAAAVDESLAIARESDDTPALHTALRDAAEVAAARDDVARARALLREAIDIAIESQAQLDGEHDLEAAAALATTCGDHARAARYARAAAAAREAFRQSPAGHVTNPRDVATAVDHEAGRPMTLESALADARDWLAPNTA